MPPGSGPIEREQALAEALARSQHELERLQRRFRSAFGHQFQFMAILAPDGRVLDFNAQLVPGIELPRAAIVGQLFWHTPWWVDQPEMQAEWPHRLAAAAASPTPVVSEDRYTSSTGQIRWASAAVHAVRDEHGALDCYIVQATDTTEQREAEALKAAMEDQLRETQKLQAIGTLAGGIAHDFNNILGAIIGNVALARDMLEAGHAAQQPLRRVKRASLRARSLVQQILAFSRQQPLVLRPQPLQPVVLETVALLDSTLPADVQLTTRLPDAALWVHCDATQIQQVLMNLCTNAWHALRGGHGRIEVGLEAMGDGERVHLWVRDDGMGMDAATRARIFEPFFTTKSIGQGTGLGLSVVHGIVASHGGTVTLDSSPGLGSVFHVHLPGADPQADAESGVVSGYSTVFGAFDAGGNGAGEGRGRHVLVLDDDEPMGLVSAKLLERAGYRVSVFSDPDLALDALRAAPEACDVLVTDFNMSGRNGLEVVRELAAIRPGLPVVLSSGYFDDALVATARALGVRHLLGKEHTLDHLCQRVAEALAGR
jgi:signal transduction histidine kinase/CheY-like chemotaxis protein